ncbi:MAG: ice-binding family protein [Bacteroidota bacterium]
MPRSGERGDFTFINRTKGFMKVSTTPAKGILGRRTRFLGTMLTIALMVPAALMSQSPAPVDLGTAGDFVILAKTGITTTGTTAITGDIGISPEVATFITGFDLILDASGAFSTSSLITGRVYASDYAVPTPTKMTTAIGDMETAYTDAAGRVTPDYTELYEGDVTGQTLTPGLYKWGTGVLVSAGGVTISGNATDVWIFQIAQDLTLANDAIVSLSGDALASNIFWQVAGQVTIGTAVQMKGIILCKTLIAMNAGASLSGRALAQAAVTTNSNAITQPTTVTSVDDASSLAPEGFSLSQNYPNPFNPSTKIAYRLEKAGQVSLKVYNMLGNEVATLVNGRQEAGSHTVTFNAGLTTLNLASGAYLYRLEAGSFVSVRKFILMK